MCVWGRGGGEGACGCLCVSAGVISQGIARNLLKSSSSNGDCLRHENASRVKYIDLDLHIQKHTDLNREDNECSIISETVQATSITSAVNVVRLKQ